MTSGTPGASGRSTAWDRNPARLVELAGKKQCLRQARERAHAQHIRALLSRRDRAPRVPDRRAHVAALDHLRTGHFHARLEIRQPKLRPLPPSALGDRHKPLHLDLRGAEQRSGHRTRPRKHRMLHKQLRGKPAHPAKKLRQPPAPNELEVPLDQQLSDHLCVPGSRGILDRLLREPVRATPGRRAAAQLARARRARARAAVPRRTDGGSDTTPRARRARPGTCSIERVRRARATESSRPRTASHNSGVKRPSTDVAHQEVLDLGRERRQNLVGQILADLASAAGELPHARVGVPKIAKPERRQIEPRGPSLRALDEQLHAARSISRSPHALPAHASRRP